jgi:DtxR family Mn-dependent transcriptional regulator
MSSQSVENYIKVIYHLSHQDNEVSVSAIAQAMDVSLPSVNSMVKKLSDLGLLNYEKYKPLSLTASGVKKAAQILRKHRLTEMYLVEKMGFGWEEVHSVAEQIEHIEAPQFFDRMDELLGYPTVDPHGSPIPDKDGNFTIQNYLRLTNCEPELLWKLMALDSASDDFLRYLNTKDLSLGTTIQVVQKEPFDNSVTIKYKQYESVNLSEKVAEKLLMAKLS